MIELRHKDIYAAFHPDTGNWVALGFTHGDSSSLIKDQGVAMEVIVEGKPFMTDRRRRLKEATLHDEGRSANLVYERAGLRITHHIEIAEEGLQLKQSVNIQVLEGGLRKLNGIHYYTPSLTVGHTSDCLLQAPGQIVKPDTPYESAAKLPLDLTHSEPVPWYPQGWLESAPDQTSGLVLIENRRMQRIVSVSQYSEAATIFPTLDGTGNYLAIAHRHQLTGWLHPGTTFLSEGHSILMSEGTLEDHLSLYRERVYGDRLVTVTDTPGWLKEARLLQIDPRPISHWKNRLKHYRDIGFNILYLLPVWSNYGNPYCVHEHYVIDQKTGREEEHSQHPEGFCLNWENNPFPVGSPEELRGFVDEAHELGFKVLFDFVPQGIGCLSTFIEEHPDWLVRDELNRRFASHGWGPAAGAPVTPFTYSMDWGNPEYRKYMVDWAVWNMETFDIDGYRTDALHWKEPNFAMDNRRQPWETMFGGVRLAEELRAALKQIKPDAILISEVWGPIFQRGHDATYENGWLTTAVNNGWMEGAPVMSGAEWSRNLALTRAVRPEGLLRTPFGANHDNERFVRLAKESPSLGDAVTFVHTFSEGIPFVFYREVKHREALYTAFFQERSKLSEYSCCYSSVESSAKELFTSWWHREGEDHILAVANVSMQPVDAVLTLRWEIEDGIITFGSPEIEVNCISGKELQVFIGAASYCLLRLTGDHVRDTCNKSQR